MASCNSKLFNISPHTGFQTIPKISTFCKILLSDKLKQKVTALVVQEVTYGTSCQLCCVWFNVLTHFRPHFYSMTLSQCCTWWLFTNSLTCLLNINHSVPVDWYQGCTFFHCGCTVGWCRTLCRNNCRRTVRTRWTGCWRCPSASAPVSWSSTALHLSLQPASPALCLCISKNILFIIYNHIIHKVQANERKLDKSWQRMAGWFAAAG